LNTKLKTILEKEQIRQQNTLGMIPSENFTSKAVREAVGSVFMHKYSEGYPFARYYEGNEVIDELETLATDMVLKVFGLSKEEWHANVQVLSGAVANLAIYTSVLNSGDKIMSMYLPDGGHLSHGWSYTSEKERTAEEEKSMAYRGGKRVVSFTSALYKVVQYKTDPKTLIFDYDFIEKLALEEKPKMIITGGTAYPRDIDYKRIREIADKIDAIYLADISHEAGLIAGQALPSPFPYADFVMFTTQKTLRGPRGAVVVCREKYAKQLDRAVFPGLQGGPFNQNIAGITQALFEADTDEFRIYANQIIKNAQALGRELANYKFQIISGGTDKHLLVIDLTNKNILGKFVSKALSFAGIISNKTTVPYEKKSPMNPSGIRIGTPLLTTRGMKEDEMKSIAGWINAIVEEAKQFSELEFESFCQVMEKSDVVKRIKNEVESLCERFPLDM
jgi:glycine hydroxymethyltransferase